jgi:acyl dehydratase
MRRRRERASRSRRDREERTMLTRTEPPTKLYLEDFSVGQIFRSGSRRITAAEIKAFAKEYDPQPFHLDDAAAKATMFGGLAASGWHTMALTMRLLVDGGAPIAGGIIGAGAEELRWPKPVRPGDELTVESEVLEIRPSRSRPTQGLMKMRSTTFNQNGEPVQVFVANLVVPRKP